MAELLRLPEKVRSYWFRSCLGGGGEWKLQKGRQSRDKRFSFGDMVLQRKTVGQK